MLSRSFLKLSLTSPGGPINGDLEGPRSRPTNSIMDLEIATLFPAKDSANINLFTNKK